MGRGTCCNWDIDLLVRGSKKADGGTWNLYLFADLRCLGRDSQQQPRESLPYFADLRHLGRDSQQADPGFSTLFTHKYMQ